MGVLHLEAKINFVRKRGTLIQRIKIVIQNINESDFSRDLSNNGMLQISLSGKCDFVEIPQLQINLLKPTWDYLTRGGQTQYFKLRKQNSGKYNLHVVLDSDLLNSIQEIKVNSYSTCILCKYIVSNYYLEKQREKEQNRNKKTIRKKLNNLHYTPKPSSAKLSDISVFRPLQGGKCSPK